MCVDAFTYICADHYVSVIHSLCVLCEWACESVHERARESKRESALSCLLFYHALKAQVRLQARPSCWVTAHTRRDGALGAR